MLSVQEKIVLDLLGGQKNLSILDVGGGHGQLSLPLARGGYDVTVLGSSAECAQRIKTEVESGKIRFQVGNIVEMPFDDDSFDVVVSIRLLPHCERWGDLVKEMCRVAKQCVIVDYPTNQSLNCLSGALFGAKKKIEGNTRPYALFSHKEVADVFAVHGYEKTALRKEFFLPMVVHRMLKCPFVSRCTEGVCGILGLRRMLGSPVVAKFEIGN